MSSLSRHVSNKVYIHSKAALKDNRVKNYYWQMSSLTRHVSNKVYTYSNAALKGYLFMVQDELKSPITMNCGGSGQGVLSGRLSLLPIAVVSAKLFGFFQSCSPLKNNMHLNPLKVMIQPVYLDNFIIRQSKPVHNIFKLRCLTRLTMKCHKENEGQRTFPTYQILIQTMPKP